MFSTDIAIKAENISKLYRIGSKDEIKDNLAITIFEFIKKPLRNYRKFRSLYRFDKNELANDSDLKNSQSDIIWALKNVSFTVYRGEVLGIIGSNGAGKSTLLKILSKITVPTTGRAEIRGRVSSLLEVGTGFHRELTGRENVYLNGTILGMSKIEVDRKYDAIVDFSGVEKFIETPVKRYSSGMQIRLAFSVAAHLEPEILMVDEVLAVGDAAFQSKCIGKIHGVAREGRTVFFVSHNMAAISRLCNKVLWMENGRIKLIGPAKDVITAYLSSGTRNTSSWNGIQNPPDDVDVNIYSVRLLSSDGIPLTVVDFDKKFQIEISYEVRKPVRNVSIGYRIADSIGNIILESMDTDYTDIKGHVRKPGQYASTCDVPAPFLKPSHYSLTVFSFIEGVRIIQIHENVLSFDVSEVNYKLNAKRFGFVAPIFQWSVNHIN